MGPASTGSEGEERGSTASVIPGCWRAPPRFPERLSLIRQALTFGGLGLGLLALARPQFGERPSSRAVSGRDVLVLLDLSRSMNAADAGPLHSGEARLSRLAAAKQAVLESLASSPGDRVGLVVFGGSAFLQLPLTADHAAFRRFLDAASTDDLANPATDLSRALTAPRPPRSSMRASGAFNRCCCSPMARAWRETSARRSSGFVRPEFRCSPSASGPARALRCRPTAAKPPRSGIAITSAGSSSPGWMKVISAARHGRRMDSMSAGLPGGRGPGRRAG